MTPRTRSTLVSSVASIALATLLGGCFPKPETAAVVSAPKTPANKTFTSFTPALRCMDDLLVAYGKRDIRITSMGMTDATSKVKVGTKEMLVRALNQMSLKSRAFTFIDYDTDYQQVFGTVARRTGTQDTLPDYYVRGSITQVDDNTLQSQAGASISLPFA